MEEQASQGSHQHCLGVDVIEAGATQNVLPRRRLSDQESPEVGSDHAVPWQGRWLWSCRFGFRCLVLRGLSGDAAESEGLSCGTVYRVVRGL